MALVFNAGTAKQVQVAKAYFVKYYNNDWSARDACYPVDTPVPFDLMPFVNEFKNDSSKSFVSLFTWSRIIYGIRFVQQNDVIIAYTAYYYSGYSNIGEIGRFQIGSFPSTYPVYFLYMNNAAGQSYSYIYVSVGSSVFLVGCASVERSAGVYKIKQVGSWANQTFGDVGVGENIPIPYSPNYMLDDVSYLDYFPTKIAFGPGENSTSTTLNYGLASYFWDNTATDLGSVTDASGQPPTPPEPPAPPWDDPNEQDPDYPSSPSDPEGDYERDYDPIPVPPKPTQGAGTAGFITLYKLHQASMSQFASDMFASSLWEALKQFFGTPMDFLVGVNLLPFEPTAGPSFKPAYGPTAVFGHAYPTVANQYVDIPCGSVELKKYWGNCFDYEPYTKIQIWLPYIGYRDLPVDEIMGQTISVMYRCDCLTGDCVAFVYTGVVGETGPQVERVISQFYGNCAVRVPFGATSYDAAIGNSIALMGAAASAGLSAGAGAIAEGGKIGAGLHAGINAAGEEMATNGASIGVVQGSKPNIHKGGAAGAATGYMSVQVPYLIRRIPRQSLPEGYMNLKGYPSNIGGKLADFTGLAIVDDIQLNNIPALEDERKEIINWLRGGVLI